MQKKPLSFVPPLRPPRAIPRWTHRAPWVAMACALALAFGVLIFELRNVKRESSLAAEVTVEKGRSLINAFESALLTGAGFHWTNEELQFLMQRTGSPADITTLALLDSKGKVLLSQPPGLEGATLLTTGEEEHAGLRYGPIHSHKGEVFRIYKVMADPSPAPSSAKTHGHEHGGTGELLPPSAPADKDKRILLVDYDMSSWSEARAADRAHMWIIGAILVFLTALSALSCYFMQAYRGFRRQLRETTALAEEILRSLPVGVVAVDALGHISTINAEALRIATLRMEEAERKELAQALPTVWEALQEDLGKGLMVVDREMRCESAGQWLPLSVSASPLTNEEGQTHGFVIILRDLGELHHLQDELRRKERLAALGTLAAGIAHEVRNPLSAIKGFARYFEECHPKGSADAEIALTLGQEVLRLNKVVGDLLDLARPDVLHLSPVTVNVLVEKARRMVEPALLTHKVEFHCTLPSPEEHILVDMDRMSQVLINLFLNAAEAMQASPENARRLEVHSSLSVRGDLLLEVKDNGPGMKGEQLQDIFSPYFTTKAKGTGLGLSIVHKIVGAHGGSIEVKNCPQGGCSFALRLPAVKVAAPQTQPAPQEKAQS